MNLFFGDPKTCQRMLTTNCWRSFNIYNRDQTMPGIGSSGLI